MRGFEANNCRLCEKAFCCEKCRIKHETNYHKVFPECDICIYGQFVFGKLEEPFLHHLESSHLPLICVYCKKIFVSIEDILQHRKCPIGQRKEDSPKSPFKQGNTAVLVSTTDQDSPILQEFQGSDGLNYIFILATSTPMPKANEPNLIFNQSKQPITPGDSSEAASRGIIKKANSVKSESSKRRVTFSDTPSNNATNISEDKKSLSSKGLELSEQKFPEAQFTPATNITEGQFYSAKSQIDQFFTARTETVSKVPGKNSSKLFGSEEFTPVCIPSVSKMTAVKGDIYKTQDLNPDNPLKTNNENSNSLNTHLNEHSVELCSPAEPSVPLKLTDDSAAKTGEGLSDAYSEKICSDQSKLPLTPANPGKLIVKVAMYKDFEQASNTRHVSRSDENSDGKEDKGADEENKLEHNSSNRELETADEIASKTLWLSAINLEDPNDSEEHKENERPNSVELDEKSDTPGSPPKVTRRKVSIVMPTPIVKKTNVQLKFNIPAHFSSTPIMSSSLAKRKHTKMVEELSTKVIRQQTPFKTPREKWSEVAKKSFMKSISHPNSEIFSDTEAGPSSTQNDIVPLSEINEDCISNEGETNIENQTGLSSVSSMTEPSLWTSMTYFVKSVLRITNVSRGNNLSIDNRPSSFKRPLSDTDSSGDFLEAPRLKRFKFTDIKCRRPIRDLSGLKIRRRLSAPTGQIATFEIMKSVSTFYGPSKLRIYCDKATQTDDYLMYGWHPRM